MIKIVGRQIEKGYKLKNLYLVKGKYEYFSGKSFQCTINVMECSDKKKLQNKNSVAV